MQNLLNEPRCASCPPGTVAKWMDEQARYVKSVSSLIGCFSVLLLAQGRWPLLALHQDCTLCSAVWGATAACCSSKWCGALALCRLMPTIW